MNNYCIDAFEVNEYEVVFYYLKIIKNNFLYCSIFFLQSNQIREAEQVYKELLKMSKLCSIILPI